MQLVIVESPAKAKTIEKYLGKDFKVLASYGHIRDLPPKDGSVRPDEDFAMDWEIYSDQRKRSQVKAIADAAKNADRLVLATDPDREGEAISWHVLDMLKKRKALPTNVDRVTFNAITKGAVTEAMKKPRALDQDLIDAYLARRALDYLFGFTLSYDEYPRTSLLTGTANTLPVEMVAVTGTAATPALYAIGTMTTVFSLTVIIVSFLAIYMVRTRRSGRRRLVSSRHVSTAA